ncbi:MAG TPA: response regulator [Candidatus Paceibacterota bacterium]|nr:response regulator [Candidatus Paceibacterota bacterium]
MKKILIVEDDTFLKNLESSKFTREGFEVMPATTSEDVARLIAQTVPDVVLLDLVLPGVDGFGILEMLKKNESTKHVPIIVFSNLSDEKDVIRAKDAGATEFIVKANYTLDEIAQKIKTIVG